MCWGRCFITLDLNSLLRTRKLVVTYAPLGNELGIHLWSNFEFHDEMALSMECRGAAYVGAFFLAELKVNKQPLQSLLVFLKVDFLAGKQNGCKLWKWREDREMDGEFWRGHRTDELKMLRYQPVKMRLHSHLHSHLLCHHLWFPQTHLKSSICPFVSWGTPSRIFGCKQTSH